MNTLLLLVLAVTNIYFPQLPLGFSNTQALANNNMHLIDDKASYSGPLQINDQTLNDISLMLKHEAPNLNPLVINKVLTTLKCVSEYNIDHNNILSIIDYSLPSNEKRLWVFDVKEKKLLFYTFVSHGIKSGQLISNYFSNKYNSK
ncbi:MAG: murein L,D-transpeptidase catalytic domain family protein, partial [Legionella longbeachae]|nr:murein L,D-transpeptidase catalytic domain family protein [Legionella longbeachae]